MEKKEGEYLCNARVDVDYSEGKPKIEFDYPGDPKKDQLKQGSLLPVTIIIWIIIGAIPFCFFAFNDIDINKNYPEDCYNATLLASSKEDNYGKIIGFEITCDGKIQEYEYNLFEEGFIKKQQLFKTYFYVLWLYISLVLSVLLNRLVTRFLVKKRWYQKWLPKANAEGIIFKTKKKKYSKFESDDVLENVIVIPIFSNVELDYKTTGEFSKYLTKIKIREHRTKKINSKTKKIGKEKVDHFKWYAIFYFKEKPKTGHLEVIYQ